MARLSAQEITIQYHADAPPILADLSLVLRAGELVGIVGPNGSGKSTLVRALSRTLAPTGGVVRLGDRDLYRELSARDAGRQIAVVPQETAIAFDFSVREVVEMGRSPRLPRHPFAALNTQDTAAVAVALDRVGVAALAERPVTTLSGGERQRVLLARALAQEGDVLLLDEPTAHLDLRHQAETLALARDLAQTEGKAVLAVLHDLNLAAAYCDQLILMQSGRIAAQGTPSEVLTSSAIETVYGAHVWVRRHPVTGRPYLLPLSERSEPLRDGPTVFVLCGGGTGASAMDALTRRGFAVVAGALNAGDSDAEAAEALGVPFPREASFTPLSPPVLAETRALTATADALLITAAPYGPANMAVLEVALLALREGKPVIALDPIEMPFAARDFTGGQATLLWTALRAEGMTVTETAAEAVAEIERLLAASAGEDARTEREEATAAWKQSSRMKSSRGS